MGFLSFLFGGKYPQTKQYEARLAQHHADYERFKTIAQSTDLARFVELKAVTSESKFKARVEKLRTEKFTDTEAYKQWAEYVALKKSKDLVSYYKFKAKGTNEKLQAALKSDKYVRYVALDAEVNTPEFQAELNKKGKNFRENLRLRFATTPEKQKWSEYKKLKKSGEKKFIEKTQASAEYKNYVAIDSSDKRQKYESLDQYVKSEQFISYRKELEDPKRYEKSEECKLLQEYAKLSKDKALLWYYEQEKNNAFQDITKWREVFVDDFEGTALDKTKWGLGYYWGKLIGGEFYSLENEKQAFRAENVEVGESKMTIRVKQEQATSKRWVPSRLGFEDDTFDYTSAVINTGDAFRQQYGRFDFKVKISRAKTVTHNIWMVGEKMKPHVNVASFGASKKCFDIGVVAQKDNKRLTIDGANFSSDYHIISLLWTPERLVWSVNGVEVHTHSGSIPQEPMYIVISSNMTESGKVGEAQIALDWVKCYTWTKEVI